MSIEICKYKIYSYYGYELSVNYTAKINLKKFESKIIASAVEIFTLS